MLKKISVVIIGLLTLALLLVLYHFFKGGEEKNETVYNHIPASSLAVVSFKDFHQTNLDVVSTNIMMQELSAISAFQDFFTQQALLDSLLKRKEAANFFQNEKLYLSIHAVGGKKIGVIGYKLVNGLNTDDLKANLKLIFNKNIAEREFEGNVIVDILLSTKEKISFTIIGDYLAASSQPELIEEAIRTQTNSNSLANDKAFLKALETAGKNEEITLLCNYQKLGSTLSFFNAEQKLKLNALNANTLWCEADVTLKPDRIFMNGFTYITDSAYFSCFANQKAGENSLVQLMPEITSRYIHFSISDFESYSNSYKSYLSTIGIKYSNINQNDAAAQITDWIGNEVVVLSLENETNANNEIGIIQLSDAEKCNDFITKQGENCKWLQLIGPFFNNFQKASFAIKNEHLIIANSTMAMDEYLLYAESQKTLTNEANYISYQQNLASKSNITFHTSIARSANQFSNYFNSEISDSIGNYLETIRKFEAFTLQFTAHTSQQFYTQLFLQYNPVYKEKQRNLWETKLDTNLLAGPYKVKNHLDNTSEIVVQDQSNQLYLISNMGKIVWKKKISGPIISEIKQIDIYKNSKLQLVFNTAEELIILDRNGEFVENTPAKLKAKATNGLSIFDYENNHNYRILIACEDLKIHNFDATAKAVNGWEFPNLKTTCKGKIFHHVVAKKDYLIFADINGNVYAIDRRGQYRFEPIKSGGTNPNYVIQKGNNLDNTYVLSSDYNSNFIKTSLTGVTENNTLKTSFLSFVDVNNDNQIDLVYSDSLGIKVVSKSQQLFSFECTSPKYVKTENNYTLIATKENSFHLINSLGEQAFGFPLKGYGKPIITDINRDGQTDFIWVEGNQLKAKSLN